MKLIKLFVMTCLFISTAIFAQVNINTASADELSALKGIGEKKAAAIIKYRKANGKFKSVSELANVSGIGETILKNLGSDVKVSGRTDITKLKNKKVTNTQKSTTKKTAGKKVTDEKNSNKKTADKKTTEKKTKSKAKSDSKTEKKSKSDSKSKTKKVKKAKKSSKKKKTG